MNPVARQLSDLKLALQDLECAVQQPRDESQSVDHVLQSFPTVLLRFNEIIRNILLMQGTPVNDKREVFSEAHKRGWLKGDLSLWLRLLADYHQVEDSSAQGDAARAVAQDVRACSCILWQTYELLTARFRWQTQVQPVTKQASPAVQRFVVQSA